MSSSYIKVTAIAVNVNGEAEDFGGETGTCEFYMVHDTLIEHLGNENVSVNWDYKEFLYVIEIKKSYVYNNQDYKKKIENIYEPFAPFNFVFLKKHHLKFKIID